MIITMLVEKNTIFKDDKDEWIKFFIGTTKGKHSNWQTNFVTSRANFKGTDHEFNLKMVYIPNTKVLYLSLRAYDQGKTRRTWSMKVAKLKTIIAEATGQDINKPWQELAANLTMLYSYAGPSEAAYTLPDITELSQGITSDSNLSSSEEGNGVLDNIQMVIAKRMAEETSKALSKLDELAGDATDEDQKNNIEEVKKKTKQLEKILQNKISRMTGERQSSRRKDRTSCGGLYLVFAFNPPVLLEKVLDLFITS